MKTAAEIRRQFIDFFVQKHGHQEIPSASLIPENDPTVLFTTAGMHPLVPFLMGEPHPMGNRLVDAQKCVRTDDIDEVGDNTHATFFEMMGNWSLGDYFKDGAIAMSYELLTGVFGLDPARLSVTCFAGDSDAPRDLESPAIWEKVGIAKDRIFFYPKKKNWWGPAGLTGPCGPDTEMFYDTMHGTDPHQHRVSNPPVDKYPPIDCADFMPGDCHPNCDCGRYVEIWNDVFMQYNKKADGTFEALKQQNVDTGLGLERMTAILQGKPTHYETELFADAIAKIKELGKVDESNPEHVKSLRIVADHIRAATFIIGDSRGVAPSNVDQGYIVRRLIRRAIRHGKLLGIDQNFTHVIGEIYVKIYGDVYSELVQNREKILSELQREEERFQKTLEIGLREVQKIMAGKSDKTITGAEAFHIFETFGFPREMIEEEMQKNDFSLTEVEQFDEAFKKHQELSRVGAGQKFAGGLADHSEECKMHHTATHLVHQALRDVLGTHVFQKGSNITKERLRFDFSQPVKMTPEQVKQVEDIVNTQIQRDLPVHFEVLETEEAKKRGAIGLFDDKYAQLGNKVKVYFMGDYSCEVCGGPHVEHTGVLKGFKILKEEAVAAGVRRIKAVVEGLKDVATA